nr:RICIN domain-containing protein [uncultured Actinoplanes sp.]
MRRVLAVAAAGLLLAGFETTPSAAEPAAEVRWQYLSNGKGTPDHQPLYMSVYGNVGAPQGTAIVLKRFDEGPNWQNQQWYFEKWAGYYMIRSAGTSAWQALSLKGNSSANGTSVIQYAYNAANEYQRWVLIWLPDGGVKIRNQKTGKCLAVAGGTAPTVPALSPVITYDCVNGADQIWGSYW